MQTYASEPFKTLGKFFISGFMGVFLATLLGCASNAGSGSTNQGLSQRVTPASKIQVCKSGDQIVASASQCLQDDAACYQISNGQWCTGERGNVCPAGSTEISLGAACPAGSRCIRLSESLTCKVN